ncbi:MAG: D-alanyl-D-alanine carboxypeptidase/D-alanyl-D-alanine-endopeptidase, partial [Hyphomonas sp.]|uniref:D-alanyl-D-alanine carboxypeptidase/D-alanyl-D-alanine endopeptidase n=1 Tax=Hyphomonas sp. TaxID=87 RepID=UPI0034A0AAF0
RNEAITGPLGSENLLSVLRWPGSDEVVLSGSLPADTAARNYFLSVPSPARTAAERLMRLLAARGIVVEGTAKVRSRSDELAGEEIARLAAPPLLQSVIYISEDSDNLAAELLLRHIARATGGEGAEDGLEALHTMLDQAGIGRAEIELFDGSGLSPYNRVTPQSTVRFLTWTTQQSWGEAFRATLPVGGQTGSLALRFRGTPLEGRIFAKTGTVQGVNALSGFLIAASGETLVFSVIANDRPVDGDPVLPVIDKLLVEIAAAN